MKKFDSENKRLDDPQARLIPKFIWDEFFTNSMMTTDEIQLMQCPESRIIDTLNAAIVKLFPLSSIINKPDLNDNPNARIQCQRLWLCLALSQPPKNATILIEALFKLGLTEEETFVLSTQIGHIEFINQLFKKPNLAPLEMISANDYKAFRAAASSGQFYIIKKFLDFIPKEKHQEMIYSAYKHATSDNAYLNANVMKGVMEMTSRENLDKMRKAQSYEEYIEHMSGDVRPTDDYLIVETLLDFLPEDHQPKIIKAANYYAFRQATRWGDISLIEKILSTPGVNFLEMIKACNYQALRNAAKNGNLKVIEKLLEITPKEYHLEMIKAELYGAFNIALGNVHVPVQVGLKLLKALPQEEGLKMMILSDYGYRFFHHAAEAGDLVFLKKFFEITPKEEHLEIIRKYNCKAFQDAAENGHLDIIKELLKIIPEDKCLEIIKANDYAVFHNAALFNNLDIMNELLKFIPEEEYLEIIKKDNYFAFSLAALNGQLPIIKKFLEMVPKSHHLEMINASEYGYDVFQDAAKVGDMNLMEKLLEVPGVDCLEMIKHNNYAAVEYATNSYSHNILQKLLSFPDVLAHVQQDQNKYGLVINHFIREKMSVLRQRKESSHWNVVLTKQEAQVCFYMLRQLIQKIPPTPDELDDIDFLISIPIVQSLLHREITPQKPNELFQLTKSLGNHMIMDRLYAIPAVMAQAEQDGFSQEEAKKIGLHIANAADKSAILAHTSTDKEAPSPTTLEQLLYEDLLNDSNGQRLPELEKHGCTNHSKITHNFKSRLVDQREQKTDLFAGLRPGRK